MTDSRLETNKELPEMPEDCVFALDIGTRSVIGIVGRPQGDLFQILATEVQEHPQRAMIDGQIEDIRQVARVAGMVKERLEERLGYALTQVNVAAAGRALKTSKAEFALDVNTGEPVTARQIYELEIGAIALAREQLDTGAESNLNFYCVGHSVVRYFLDDYPFSTILGHKGASARAQIIATFLPAEVVDSLCAAMAMIGCEISHLTLEPIAAMNAVIPSELRLLNLALVDIGAGTSDIAISEGGSVAAYTMATVAGDEITEEIIRKYLVDFHTAEGMKHAAARGDEDIPYQDILGFEYTVPLKELLTSLRPAVENLANVICERIMETNSKIPAAVFLVGGGSLAPLLCDFVAGGLSLDRKKVAVGGNNFIKRVASSEQNIAGPEFATPIGIALTAVAEGAQHGFHVFVNGKRTRLFRNEQMAVMDVLLLCGYRYHDLMGRNGKNINYTLNGKKHVLRGGHLQTAVISVNGVEANISTPVNNEDHIDITPAVNGEDAFLTLTLLDMDPVIFSIKLNGSALEMGRRVLLNQEPAQPGQEIHDLDQLQIQEVLTLSDLCTLAGMMPGNVTFMVNGANEALDYRLKDGDDIVCQAIRSEPAISKEIRELLEAETPEALPPAESDRSAPEAVIVESMGQAEPIVPAAESAMPLAELPTADAVAPAPAEIPLSSAAASVPLMAVGMPSPAAPVPSAPVPPAAPLFSQPPVMVEGNGDKGQYSPLEQNASPSPLSASGGGFHLFESKQQQPIRVTLNDNSVLLEPKEGNMPYQFIDMLNMVDLDPTKPQGNIVLMLNGLQASYLDELRNGDVVEIRWEER